MKLVNKAVQGVAAHVDYGAALGLCLAGDEDGPVCMEKR